MDAGQKYFLFLDLDGVLVDFDKGVQRVCGKAPMDLEPRQMWPRLARTIDFYANLDWMPDGKVLWDFSKKYHPVILTGVPRGTWAEPQKRDWCRRELGDVEVITCASREKAAKAGERSEGRRPILVDDRIKLKEAWEDAGGIFIWHENSKQSIEALKGLGF